MRRGFRVSVCSAGLLRHVSTGIVVTLKVMHTTVVSHIDRADTNTPLEEQKFDCVVMISLCAESSQMFSLFITSLLHFGLGALLPQY